MEFGEASDRRHHSDSPTVSIVLAAADTSSPDRHA